jgi:tRNA G18 (ribose-2'-O)-methylase SpoU
MEKLSMAEIEAQHAQLKQNFAPLDFVMILDNVRSALNVGAIFRTADVFALQQLYLCGITAQPPAREVLKTALGATDTVSWQHKATTLEAVEECRAQGYQILALEQVSGSILLQNLAHETAILARRKIAVILGHEVEGVAAEVVAAADAALQIPQFGNKHSLNVSVAAGIVAWEVQMLFSRNS